MGNVNETQFGASRTGTLKCIKCSSSPTFDDASILKIHALNEHIKRKRKHVSASSSADVKSKRSKLARMNENDLAAAKNSQSHDEDDDEDDDDVDDKVGRIAQRLDELDGDDDFIKFNIGEKIDERSIYQRARVFTPSNDYDKTTEFQKDKIAWAKDQRHTYKWPCRIEKLEKLSKSGSRYKVVVRFYEKDPSNPLLAKLSVPFKRELVDVELFFRNEEHFYNKTHAPMDEKRRYDFFLCYTKALNDFIEQLVIDEQRQHNNTRRAEKNSRAGSKTPPSKRASPRSLNGDPEGGTSQYQIEQMRKKFDEEAAASEKLQKINEKRKIASQRLLNILMTNDCKEHVIGIANGTTKCDRHKKYVEEVSDQIRRKNYYLQAVGPLVNEHRIVLIEMLEPLCPNDIREQFRNYVLDVLYPEAVIWGLQRIYKINSKKAEKKFYDGFERTKEELSSFWVNRSDKNTTDDTLPDI